MEFSEACSYFAKIENESKKLKKEAYISDLIQLGSPKEAGLLAYISTDNLGPSYNSLVLGIKDEVLKKVIANIEGIEISEINRIYREVGDIGDLIARLGETHTGTQTGLDDFFGDGETYSYTIEEVWDLLVQISMISGKESNLEKRNIIQSALRKMSALEKKYFARILVGNTRLGSKEKQWLSALSSLSNIDKSLLDRAFALCSDIGKVVSEVVEKGNDALESLLSLNVGIPIQSMAAQRVNSASEAVNRLGEKCVVEHKYDGYRIQIHISKSGSVSLWSRNNENYNQYFPEIIEAIENSGIRNIIVDGEIVAYNYETAEIENFQLLTQRRTKHFVDEVMKSIQTRVFLFDILYYEDRELMNLPFLERRKILEDISFNSPLLTNVEISTAVGEEEIDHYLLTSKANNVEGIMLKSISEDAKYEPGKRSYYWLKYKVDYKDSLSDSFDLVVIGAHFGKGKRTNWYGTLLLASYDPETDQYYSFCRMGAGMNEDHMEMLTKDLDAIRIESKPENYVTNLKPDIWVMPRIILEIRGAEITDSSDHTVPTSDGRTIALRFPRFTGRIRDDKKAPEGITTIQEIEEIAKSMIIGTRK